jgi:hypothetical protein
MIEEEPSAQAREVYANWKNIELTQAIADGFAKSEPLLVFDWDTDHPSNWQAQLDSQTVGPFFRWMRNVVCQSVFLTVHLIVIREISYIYRSLYTLYLTKITSFVKNYM